MGRSERALLNRLMIELHKLDSDILVGHNISGFDLDVLLHRAQVGKLRTDLFRLVSILMYTFEVVRYGMKKNSWKFFRFDNGYTIFLVR